MLEHEHETDKLACSSLFRVLGTWRGYQGCFDRGGQSLEWALNCIEKSWSYADQSLDDGLYVLRRFTLDMAWPGVNSHSDNSQRKRVSLFSSMPPVP